MQENVLSSKSFVIWRLIDGKPGHDNQTLGLVKALSKKADCQYFDIQVSGLLKPVINFLFSSWPQGQNLPLPDLIIGAGHRTHFHLLAAQKVYGGKTVVLMQPSLPAAMFDLCLIPEHDEYQGRADIVETRGVLNPIQPSGQHHMDRALIMIGGPSKHFDWDEEIVMSQLKALIEHHPDVTFTLTTSRRTPDSFLSTVKAMSLTHLQVVPFEETTKEWVAEQLAASEMSWVSEDSASMVYEALTSQTAVGVLTMPVKKQNRLSKGIENLIAQKTVVRFDNEGMYKAYMKPAIGFLEADRCANVVLTRWSEAPAPATVSTQFLS